jgi:uncharacterized protein
MSPTFDVNNVLDERFVPCVFEGTIDIDEFIVGDEAFAVQAPASYVVSMTALEDGIVVQGTVALPIGTACARCLVDFDTAITATVDSMFYYVPTVDDDGDPYPEVDEFGHIELDAELIEDLIVEAPLAPLHDPECKGICFMCGVDRNIDSCTCEDDAVDETHPFAGLDALLDSADE